MSQWIRRAVFGLEILIVTGLILATRCANYQEVFVGGNIYYVDADCYSRMTRVRLCAQHPGLILRHHSFENFPQGTTPHTTAPFDYAILLLSLLVRPFTPRPIELAGGLISPVLAVLSAIFLCWWARYMRFRFRWATLVLFAVSPILVHGTALGRPDHQSLLIGLVVVAVCSDWSGQRYPTPSWKVVSGLAWGLAIWVSAYEPLLLLLVSTLAAGISHVLKSRTESVPASKRLTKMLSLRKYPKLLTCLIVLLIALAIERRLPSFSVFVNDPIFRNWSRTIGELAPTPLLSRIWFNWLGWLALVSPVLLVLGRTMGPVSRIPSTVIGLLVLTFLLTLWQARWAYFFAVMFVIALPELLGSIPTRWAGWILFVCSLWPVLRDWDTRMWPDDPTLARRTEQRNEAIELRELSLTMMSRRPQPFLAPWWLSPAIAYWSGQPGIAGSSHESLSGIADSARFFLTKDPAAAAEILQRRQAGWVVAYDAQRVEANSSAILGQAIPENSMARVLDQRSAQAPAFLRLSAQTGTQKLFQVANKW